MPTLHGVRPDAAVRALERLGFSRVRQRGSHLVMQKVTTAGTYTCPVPMHNRVVPVGTLKSIIKLAHVSVDEFLAALH